jgi:hypothetical protein
MIAAINFDDLQTLLDRGELMTREQQAIGRDWRKSWAAS